MIHLQSSQRLYISEDLRGYIDKLIDDGIIPYAVDFLQLGFAYAVQEKLEPAAEFEHHTITANTDILGEAKAVIESVAQWYARENGFEKPEDSASLLTLICNLSISGGRALQERWASRSKSQVQRDIATSITNNL